MDSIIPPLYQSHLIQKIEQEIFYKEEEINFLHYEIYGLRHKHLISRYQRLSEELDVARKELHELQQQCTSKRNEYFCPYEDTNKESLKENPNTSLIGTITDFKILKPQSTTLNLAPCRPGFKSLAMQSPHEEPVIIAELKNDVAQLEVGSSIEVKNVFATSEDVPEAQNVEGPRLTLCSSKLVDFLGVEQYLQVSACPRTTIQLAIFPRIFSELKKIASRTREAWVLSLFLILPHFKIRGRIFSKKGRMVRSETLKHLGICPDSMNEQIKINRNRRI